MTRHLVSGLALVALSFVSPSPAVAASTAIFPAVYDTVDAVEVWGSRVTVTGIISGQASPSELVYVIYDGTSASTSPEGAARCDRLAMLAMAKPGKYQFAMTGIIGVSSRFGCKLITRAP